MTSSKAAPGAEFAGRTAELSIMMEAAAAASSGRFATVLISGELGIGKTRLAEEACIHARELGFTVFAGRCFDSHSAISYFPFIQVLSALARYPAAQGVINQDRRASKQSRPAAGIVARLTGLPPNSSRSRPETVSAAQTKLFESVVSFLKQRSDICPLLLVLEDLDWADDSSLALLLYLVRMLSTARLMIIATCRANEARQRLELVRTLAECERYRSYQRIRLKGLPDSEAAKLAEQLLGPESTSAARPITVEIARLTNGNPLFIHQVVRYFAEAIAGKQTLPLPSGWKNRLAAHEPITELVDARLSQLSEPCRNALSQAAVLGANFEFEVLAEMLSWGSGGLADLMKEACDAAVLTEAHNDESSDYAFVHPIILDSLYERQSRPAKRAAHADAARAIEAVHAADLESHLAQLAFHYARAGRAGDLAKAAEYSIRAGENASKAAAYADAARHWRTALQLVSARDRRQRAQLTERLGEASLSAATPAEAARHLQTALKLYAEIGQQADAARVHARLVQAISLLSMSPAAIDVAKAVSHSRRAEKLLATRADPSAEGELLWGEAFVAHAQFRTEEGLIASKRAMEIAQLLNDNVIWCQAAALHGHLLFASGKLREGIGLMEQACEQAEHTHDLKPRFAAASFLSFSYLLLWDPSSAERTIQAALADTDGSQVEFLQQILVAYLGIANVFAGAFARAQSFLTTAPHQFLEANIRIAEGEWGQAEALLNQQIERSDLTQGKQQHWAGSLWLARLKRVQGDAARALELLTKTPLISESLLRIPEEISTRTELALVRLARGEVAEARSEVRRCRDLLDPAEDWRGLLAFVNRAEAAVMACDGLLDEACQLWTSAAELFSRYRLPWEVAETFVIWGSLLARQGRADEGTVKFRAAAQIYRHLQLGARWDDRVAGLSSSARLPLGPLDGSRGVDMLIQTGTEPPDSIHSLVTTHDVALLATLIHDAIAHLMNAIDKAAKLRVPIERIAAATEEISRISTPVERLARALEKSGRDCAPLPLRPARSAQSGRAGRQKLNRSHDPGRPL